MIALLAFLGAESRGLFDQVQGFMLGVATLIGSMAVMWKFKPTRFVISRLIQTFTSPISDWVNTRIHEGVVLGTNDIRSQVYPNGGSSLLDQNYRLEQRQAETGSRIREMIKSLDEIKEQVSARDQRLDEGEIRFQKIENNLLEYVDTREKLLTGILERFQRMEITMDELKDE